MDVATLPFRIVSHGTTLLPNIRTTETSGSNSLTTLLAREHERQGWQTLKTQTVMIPISLRTASSMSTGRSGQQQPTRREIIPIPPQASEQLVE